MSTTPEQRGTQSTPRQLPIVNIDGKKYFQDDRLGEYRSVENPHDRIPMDAIPQLLAASDKTTRRRPRNE